MEYGDTCSIFVTFNEHDKVPYCFSLGIFYVNEQALLYSFMISIFTYTYIYAKSILICDAIYTNMINCVISQKLILFVICYIPVFVIVQIIHHLQERFEFFNHTYCMTIFLTFLHSTTMEFNFLNSNFLPSIHYKDFSNIFILFLIRPPSLLLNNKSFLFINSWNNKIYNGNI